MTKTRNTIIKFYEEDYIKELKSYECVKEKVKTKEKVKLILSVVGKNKNWEICDVGCGYGFEVKALYDKGYKVCGCDLSKIAIAIAKRKNPGPKYFVWDIENKPMKKRFDFIYSINVIEHIFDYDAFVSNIRKSLKFGGKLLITTPNILGPMNRLKVLFGKDDIFRVKGHVRFFSLKFLLEILERNGFDINRIPCTGKLTWISKNLCGNIFVIANRVI